MVLALSAFVSACGADAPSQNPSVGSMTPTVMAPQPSAASLPCAVSEILAANCQSCHGSTLANGAPMALVSLSDLTAPARSDATRKVFQVVAQRVQERMRPMPPDPTKRLSDTAIGVLQNWAASGALPGAACPAGGSAVGAAGSGSIGAAGMGIVAAQGTAGTAGAILPAAGMQGGAAGGSVSAAGSGSAGQVVPAAGSGGAPVAGTAGQGTTVSPATSDADIETCYELRAHGQPLPGDNTPYTVPAGENYTGFVFQAPWTKPVQALRFRHLPDNKAVLHHWLLYSEAAPLADGTIDQCDLAGPTGFLCGQATTRGLITGWAPGREDFRLPAEVGLELPAPGELLAVEFHYYNTTGAAAADRSGVEVCVTSKFRPNTASITWLGTQKINLPPRQLGMASGTCSPLRTGMNATDPIHVLFSWPHMHKLGVHMKSVVNRVSGMQEVMYDGDFSFDFQVVHESPALLQPGDSVTTTCSYQNDTSVNVGFGQSTDQEMCFNFVYAWPAHALDNPGAEIGGATNACLH